MLWTSAWSVVVLSASQRCALLIPPLTPALKTLLLQLWVFDVSMYSCLTAGGVTTPDEKLNCREFDSATLV